MSRLILPMAIVAFSTAFAGLVYAQPALPPAGSVAPSASPPPAPTEAPVIAEDRDPMRTLVTPAVPTQAPVDKSPPPPAVVIAAEEPPTAEKPAPQPQKPHKQHIALGTALTASVVESKGLDAFSADDGLAFVSAFGTFTPWDTKPLSVHLTLEWDWTKKSALARGADSVLDIHRLGAGLMVRYLPITRMALSVRAVPSAISLAGRIKDAAFGEELQANAWTWGLDLTGGAAARVGAFGLDEGPRASIWIGLDFGYRIAGPAALALKPGNVPETDADRQFGSIPMTQLDMSGFIGRLNVSVSF
ncbi:MAG: hypothetical protein IPK82_32040 [Polyangiaceae bacterium]|nr:hypothetical protein [Polyangiaceae bacterium]